MLKRKVKIGPFNIKWLLFWAYGLGLMLLMVTLYNYQDIRSNTAWAMNLTDSFFDGRINEFYLYVLENRHGAVHPVMGGNILSLIPCAVWNLPIWIASRFFGVTIVSSPVCMLWAKLYLVFCMVVTLFLGNAIMVQMKIPEKQRNIGAFMSATAVMTYVGIGMAGGFDICSIAVFTGAVLALMKEKKFLFLVLAGFAVAFKPFCLFAVFAVVLFKEKNIFRILLNMAMIMLPTVLITLLYKWAPGYEENFARFNDNSMAKLFTPTIDVGATSISALVLFLGGLFIYSYFIKEEDPDRSNEYVVYLITLSYAIMFLWTDTNFYRGIMLMPFLYILIAKKSAYFKLNVILEMFMELAWFVFISMRSIHIFGAHWIWNSIFPVFNRPSDTLRYRGLRDIFNLESMTDLSDICYPTVCAVFAIGIIGLSVILHPRFKAETKHDLERCDEWIFTLRSLVPAFFVGLSLLFYFVR